MWPGGSASCPTSPSNLSPAISGCACAPRQSESTLSSCRTTELSCWTSIWTDLGGLNHFASSDGKSVRANGGTNIGVSPTAVSQFGKVTCRVGVAANCTCDRARRLTIQPAEPLPDGRLWGPLIPSVVPSEKGIGRIFEQVDSAAARCVLGYIEQEEDHAVGPLVVSSAPVVAQMCPQGHN